MNIVIVGSNGYIATFVKRYMEMSEPSITIYTVDCVGKTDYMLALENPTEFNYRILENIDYVIFTAAISSPDQCMVNPKTCWTVNVVGTEYFIRQALNLGCRVIFFSSDAVFGNTPTEIAYEDTPTKGSFPYGAMKRHVEDSFRNHKNFKAVRLSYVVSLKDRFISYCLKCIQEEKTAEIYHPFYRNCVSIHDVAETICWLLYKWNDLGTPFLNITGTELVSRLQIADELNRLMSGQLKYSVVYPGSDFYKGRAEITQMGSLYLYEKGILRRRSFFELLREEMKGVKNK